MHISRAQIRMLLILYEVIKQHLMCYIIT